MGFESVGQHCNKSRSSLLELGYEIQYCFDSAACTVLYLSVDLET